MSLYGLYKMIWNYVWNVEDFVSLCKNMYWDNLELYLKCKRLC